MLRFIRSACFALAVLAICASRAGAANSTVESVNAETGAVTAKTGDGQSITVVVEPGLAGSIKRGQVVLIDSANGTMTLAVPVHVQRAGGGEVQATANAAGAAKPTKTSSGGKIVLPPNLPTPTASEGSTAGAIRGRP